MSVGVGCSGGSGIIPDREKAMNKFFHSRTNCMVCAHNQQYAAAHSHNLKKDDVTGETRGSISEATFCHFQHLDIFCTLWSVDTQWYLLTFSEHLLCPV